MVGMANYPPGWAAGSFVEMGSFVGARLGARALRLERITWPSCCTSATRQQVLSRAPEVAREN
eukprot:6184102-Pleurochrysis_carterae.AAC.1